MRVTVTAVEDVLLPHPFSVELSAGSTSVAEVRLVDILGPGWAEIVSHRQSGKVTVAWDSTTSPFYDEEVFIDYLMKNSGIAADAVASLAALRAVVKSDRANRQIRLVQNENSLYRFELGAVAGGEIPDDEDNGRWFEVGSAVNDWGLVGEIAALAPGAAAAIGSVSKIPKVDHVHPLTMGLVGELVAIAPDTAAAVGTTDKLPRIDHAHAIATGVVGEVAALAPDSAASAGVVSKVARIDHVHPQTPGVVGDIQAVGTSASAGTANSFPRSDHVHALAATPAHIAAIPGTGGQGIPFQVVFDCTGAQNGKIFDANCPRKLAIVDVTVLPTAISIGGTVALYDGDPAGGGTLITDAIACAAVGTVGRAGSIAITGMEVPAGGTLWYGKNAAGDAGLMIITCIALT